MGDSLGSQIAIFLFDIPELESSKRRQLTRALTKANYGCLQNSVWILPGTPPEIGKLIASDDPDCTHLLLLPADFKDPKVDAKMVEGAWDFEADNSAYQKLQEILEHFPQVARDKSRDSLAEWTARESATSRAILRIDPLLPSELLPKNTWVRKHGKTVARSSLKPPAWQLH